MFAELEAAALRSYPRAVALEDRFADLLPEVMLGVDVAASPRSRPRVHPAAGAHRRVPSICTSSACRCPSRPSAAGDPATRGVGQWASFTELVADCGEPIEIVGRFLALLELYRARTVAFEQSEPLGVLQVSWTGDRPSSEEIEATSWKKSQTMTDEYSDSTDDDRPDPVHGDDGDEPSNGEAHDGPPNSDVGEVVNGGIPEGVNGDITDLNLGIDVADRRTGRRRTGRGAGGAAAGGRHPGQRRDTGVGDRAAGVPGHRQAWS